MRRRPPAILVGNAPALDFLNSIATPLDTPIDWIADGEGFLHWLEQAGLAPAAALAAIRAGALPGDLDAVADQARRLREWFRGFVRRHLGRPLPAAALAELEPLNRLLGAMANVLKGRIIPRPAARRQPAIPATAGSRHGAPRRSRKCCRWARRWRNWSAIKGFCHRAGLRGRDLHAAVRRPHPRPRAPLVQHGDLRQPRQAGGASPAREARHPGCGNLSQSSIMTLCRPSSAFGAGRER